MKGQSMKWQGWKEEGRVKGPFIKAQLEHFILLVQKNCIVIMKFKVFKFIKPMWPKIKAKVILVLIMRVALFLLDAFNLWKMFSFRCCFSWQKVTDFSLLWKFASVYCGFTKLIVIWSSAPYSNKYLLSF